MHAALVVALLGFIGTVMGIPKTVSYLQGAQIERPAAAVAQALTAVFCLILIIFGVNSFIAARRARS
jgi:multisubunit Na+/H+ antiporter MnhF subunit